MGKAFIELHNTVKKKQTAGSCPPSERRKPAGNSSPRPELLCPEFSYPSPIIFFRHLNHLIQPHGDCAENQDGGDHHIQLEQAGCGGEKIGQPTEILPAFLNGLPSNTADGKIKNIRTGNSLQDEALSVRYAVPGERNAKNDERF